MLALGLLAIVACDVGPTEPAFDCTSAVGAHFVALTPEYEDFDGPMVYVGDSLQLGASVRQVTESAATFSPLQGYFCRTVESVPVSASITYSTADTAIISVSATGWVRGRSHGNATVLIKSTNPPVERQLGVLSRVL